MQMFQPLWAVWILRKTSPSIQRIEKIRIFAQSLLKIASSRARFAMLDCYIKKDK